MARQVLTNWNRQKLPHLSIYTPRSSLRPGQGIAARSRPAQRPSARRRSSASSSRSTGYSAPRTLAHSAANRETPKWQRRRPRSARATASSPWTRTGKSQSQLQLQHSSRVLHRAYHSARCTHLCPPTLLISRPCRCGRGCGRVAAVMRIWMRMWIPSGTSPLVQLAYGIAARDAHQPTTNIGASSLCFRELSIY